MEIRTEKCHISPDAFRSGDPAAKQASPVINLEHTTFIFGEWAISGVALAEVLGLTEKKKPTQN